VIQLATEKEVRHAIKTLDAAWQALESLMDGDESANDGRVRLCSDIREYLEYLERAKLGRTTAADLPFRPTPLSRYTREQREALIALAAEPLLRRRGDYARASELLAVTARLFSGPAIARLWRDGLLAEHRAGHRRGVRLNTRTGRWLAAQALAAEADRLADDAS
jgi:hypothetical protein